MLAQNRRPATELSIIFHARPRGARGRCARRSSPHTPLSPPSHPCTGYSCAARRLGRSCLVCDARLREQCVPRPSAAFSPAADPLTPYIRAAAADSAGFADDMLTFDSDSDMLTDFDDEVRRLPAAAATRAGLRGYLTRRHPCFCSGRRQARSPFRPRTSTGRWRSALRSRPAYPCRCRPARSSATSGGRTRCRSHCA